MTSKEAKALKVGDLVSWDPPDSEYHCPLGEVIEKGYCAIKIKWCDGQVGPLHFNDCARMERKEN